MRTPSQPKGSNRPRAKTRGGWLTIYQLSIGNREEFGANPANRVGLWLEAGVGYHVAGRLRGEAFAAKFEIATQARRFFNKIRLEIRRDRLNAFYAASSAKGKGVA